jgi:hypothetical protein
MNQGRWPHEMLCSLILAFVIVAVNDGGGNSVFLGKLAYPIYTYIFPLLQRFYHDESYRTGYPLFFLMTFLLVSIIFILFRLTSYLPLITPLVLVSMGIVDVAAAPLGLLRLRFFYHTSETMTFLLLLEIFAIATAIVFYVYRRWPIPSLVSISVLAGHFALWSWVGHSYQGLSDLGLSYGYWSATFLGTISRRIAFPLLSFLATLFLARYVKRMAPVVQSDAGKLPVPRAV